MQEGRPGPADATTSRAGRGAYIPAAPRVSQVDVEELDEGLVGMLAEKIERGLGNVKFGLSTTIKPEISLVLKLVLFRLSFLTSNKTASPGARLQNLRLIQDTPTGSHRQVSRRILLLYLLLHPPIFPAYLLERIRTYALSQQWPDLPAHDRRRKAWRSILLAENASRLWEFSGWIWFLWDKRYPSLLMRILRLRLAPASAHLTRLVSYEFMNRQLVWSAFTEFLIFAVPLLPGLPPTATIRPALSQMASIFRRHAPIDYTSIPSLDIALDSGKGGDIETSGKSRAAHSGPLAHLTLDVCPICHLRYTSALTPLDTLGAGASISLPPVNLGAGTSAAGDLEAGGDAEVNEETRIFVPAQTDCWGGCRWCYYCIGEKLAECRDEFEANKSKGKGRYDLAQRNRGGGTESGKDAAGLVKHGAGEASAGGDRHDQPRWECLRCGGAITRAWRVGAH